MGKEIVINDLHINTDNKDSEDFICITDMLLAKDGDFFITDWLRNANTLDFLAAWEQMHNKDFNYGEYAIIRSRAWWNTHRVSVKEWVKKTNAIWIYAKTWRYWWTYAHKDIAFEFWTWISPTFKLLLIKEYQRLKDIENNQYNLEWNVSRVLASVNYRLHTDAVKDYIIPKSNYSKDKKWLHYAEEADILNVAVWGYTKKEWVDSNPQLVLGWKNQRDYASINELVVMSRLETLSDDMIKKWAWKKERFTHLKKTAKEMLERLNKEDFIKSIKKKNESTYIDLEWKTDLSSFNQKLKKGLNYSPKD